MSAQWGPAAWKFLHTITFSYPENPTLQDQRDAEALFLSLTSLLPCNACRDHYKSEVLSRPPDTRSRATLSAWLVDLHNRVNLRLSKPTVSYSDAEHLYGSGQCNVDCGSKKKIKSPPENDYTNYYLFGIIFLCALIILLMTKK